MSEDQACCACLAVTYQPEQLEGGLTKEVWRCTQCGAEFTRRLYAYEKQIKTLKEQLGIWKRKAGENQLVAGRYQYMFEEAMKAVNKIDDLFEYVYTSMHPVEIRKSVYTALSAFTDSVEKFRKSPTDERDKP